MKFNYLFSFIIFFFTISILSAQDLPKDSIVGNVKSVREKVIFLTEKENPQMLYDSDYGHSGFMGPKSTVAKFFTLWYSTPYSYFINYERFYLPNRKIDRENWFGKKGELINSYRYIYDKKNRLISRIDSTSYSISTENHFYREYGENDEHLLENIFYQSLAFNNFAHIFKYYKDGKLSRRKNFDDDGSVRETINYYNEAGKLDHQILKDPSTWVQLENNGHSYGVYDSIGVIYKSLQNFYDSKNRLIKTQEYAIDGQKYSNDIVEGNQRIMSYKGDNLVRISTIMSNQKPYYDHFEYNKANQLTAKYCCDEDIFKAQNIEKYKYKNGVVSELSYTRQNYHTKKMEKSYSLFTYKYDAHHNWVEIIKSVDGVALYKWIREIEYY